MTLDHLHPAERDALNAFWAAGERLGAFGYWVGLLTPEHVLTVAPELTRAAAAAFVRDHDDDWTEYLMYGEPTYEIIAEVMADASPRNRAPEGSSDT